MESSFFEILSVEFAEIAEDDKFKLEIVDMEIEADKALLF